MRQALGPGALGRPRGIRWRGRWEGGSGWGTHVNPWLILVSVWQNPLQYCKVISLQLIKIYEKKKKKNECFTALNSPFTRILSVDFPPLRVGAASLSYLRCCLPGLANRQWKLFSYFIPAHSEFQQAEVTVFSQVHSAVSRTDLTLDY